MEPNQTVGDAPAPAPASAPVSTPASAPEQNMMSQGVSEKKKGKGAIYGMVLLAILAAGGIGFGVWAMMDGNAGKAQLQEQIDALKTINAQLQEKIDSSSSGGQSANNSTNTDTPVATATDNPVIKSSDSGKEYFIRFTKSVGSVDGDGANGVSIRVKDGRIYDCESIRQTNLGDYGSTYNKIADCNITGLEGEIYKPVSFGSGQDGSNMRIGFIMKDGTVKYTSLLMEAIQNGDYGIKGTLTIDGRVSDVLELNVTTTENGYGYGSTVFVLNNGNYVEFDESML